MPYEYAKKIWKSFNFGDLKEIPPKEKLKKLSEEE